MQTAKRILITIGKILVVFFSFIGIYLLCTWLLPKITIDAEKTENKEMEIFILTNGVHTDIVVPVKSEIMDWTHHIKFEHTASRDSGFRYLAMGWGDKGFYLQTPTWADLKASVAFRAAFGLSTTAIHATFYRMMEESDICRKIIISRSQYQRLVNYIEGTLQKDTNGMSIYIPTNANYGPDDAFYEANGSYSMFTTCNTWANNALKAAGLRCCLWTAFDKGIFSKYERSK